MPSESVLLRSIAPSMPRHNMESLPIRQLLSLCSNWHIVWAIHYLTSNHAASLPSISHKKPLQSKIQLVWQIFKQEQLAVPSKAEQGLSMFPAEYCKENEKMWQMLQQVAFERLLVSNSDFSELDLARTGGEPDSAPAA